MKNNGIRAFLLAVVAVIVAAFIGYLSGAFDSYLGRKPAEPAQPQASIPASTPEASEVPPEAAPAEVPVQGTDAAEKTENAEAEQASAAEEKAPKDADADETAQENANVPVFDVLRVEGDGSVVVAGKAVPGATVELFDGTTALGKATAGHDGAFAIVLDHPLQAGDHQITLRATEPDGTIVTSVQTAVVAIPDKPDGQVLALVEEPGKAAQLLTVPQPQSQAETPAAAAETPAAATDEPAGNHDVEAEPAESAQAPVAAATEPADEQKPAVEAKAPQVSVMAVEIDGGKIFIAGRADAGRKVRAYANEILLGEAITSPDGHFLVEATHDLAVGEYTIRVDALEAGSDKVVARAQVPFQREPGEVIAAIAAQDQDNSDKAQGAETDETAAAAAVPAAPTDVDGEAEKEEQPTTTTAPKLQHAQGSVIIRRGDTLWHISRRVYGHGIRYSTIYLANQDQIADPDRIWPGQVFKVPEKSKDGEPADFDSMGDRITVQPQ